MWTEQQIAILSERWLAGNTAEVIARELGKTRSAVLGKIGRLGLARSGPDRSHDPDPNIITFWFDRDAGSWCFGNEDARFDSVKGSWSYSDARDEFLRLYGVGA
jgi:hypothetical protein